jgi:hypothetical protein
VVKVRWHGRRFRSTCGRNPSRVMGDFSADYIFRASCEVVDLVEAFEEPSASYVEGGEQRLRRQCRFGKENAVYLETCKGWGGGGVLACKEV